MSTHIALRIAEDVTARHYPGVDIHSASRAANVCDARGAALWAAREASGCTCAELERLFPMTHNHGWRVLRRTERRRTRYAAYRLRTDRIAAEVTRQLHRAIRMV